MSASALAGRRAFTTPNRVAAILLFFAVLPFLMPYKTLAINALVYGLFTAGFNLLFGYLGRLSFGHAAFFGVGAYACGLAIANGRLSIFLAIPLGVAAGAIGAAVMGALVMRVRGVYFSMVTLALAQLIYFILYQAKDLTGGENGLRGVNVDRVDVGPLHFNMVDPLVKYYVVFAFAAIAIVLMSRLLDSPFGASIEAVRENEQRARACGFDVARIGWITFVISGAVCGLAGALDAITLSVVPIDVANYTTSGSVVIMALLGGFGTFFGPFLGAIILLVLENLITLATPHWQLVVGIILTFLVLFLPRGVWGTIQGRFAR
ncbi:MAG: branched-chain amino acid ABC transporter permease [Candidatus Velthaea sp.]